MLNDLFASTIYQILEVELGDHLGYDNKNKNTKNSRNGYRNKNAKSDFGEVTLNTLRNRNGDFEPKIIRNYENHMSRIENQVIGMN
ncbi:transposase [Clostridioides sp. ZZV14-5902]|uniref:transposase n=1 Tax=Clostridioides sp. ZZV14-5902 TaxID=2811486 RepID=UPI0020D27ADA